MKTYLLKTACFAAAVSLLGTATAHAITANPLISRGKTVKLSNGTAAALVDGKFGGGAFTFSANSWFAIDLGTGPSKIFITWNSISYTWSDKIADPGRSDCKQTPSYPVGYTIQTSANSTDGSDGDWTTAVTISDNKVTARGHAVDFTGKRWVKMSVASSNRTNEKIDEVEVFDASKGGDDTWFFAGTSISANAYKSFPTIKTFPAWVNEAHADFYPAIVRGGIPCITSAHFARDISMYLDAAGSCRFWAIEMGTNDAWDGKNDNVPAFKKNLQLVIDSCKARGIAPIIANVLATDSAKAKWQVHPDFAKAVADLVKTNDLFEGPDFFAAFKANPTYLNSDGVHPNNNGGAAMHKLWAEKMNGVYTGSAVRGTATTAATRGSRPHLTVIGGESRTGVRVDVPGVLSVYSLNGRLVGSLTLRAAGFRTIPAVRGCRILRFEFAGGSILSEIVQ
jgi:lysophospholipase L1-like esterase